MNMSGVRLIGRTICRCISADRRPSFRAGTGTLASISISTSNLYPPTLDSTRSCSSTSKSSRTARSKNIPAALRRTTREPTSISTLDHRIHNYSTTATAKTETEEFPLPLPRSINPSTGLFLLHIPIPPIDWPSHLDFLSPLYADTSKWFKQKGVVVNCIYKPGTRTRAGTESRDGIRATEERYEARLITPLGSQIWVDFGKDTLSDKGFLKDIERLLPSTSTTSTSVTSASTSASSNVSSKGKEEEIEILVCTHGSRDCRCSDRGTPLVNALRDEIERRGLDIKVREIAHVGGHKYAANAITLPSMDMYSNLLPSDAESMIDHLLPSSPKNTNEKDVSPFYIHWRGRYGLTESEQLALWSTIDPTPISPSSSAEPEPVSEMGKKKVILQFKTFEGEIRDVEAEIGDTLLQVARKADLPSMEGSCGGNLECSTCHLYVPPTAPIPESSDEEFDMLGYALGYKEDESRLGCQIVVDEELGRWCAEGGILGLPRY